MMCLLVRCGLVVIEGGRNRGEKGHGCVIFCGWGDRWDFLRKLLYHYESLRNLSRNFYVKKMEWWKGRFLGFHCEHFQGCDGRNQKLQSSFQSIPSFLSHEKWQQWFHSFTWRLGDGKIEDGSNFLPKSQPKSPANGKHASFPWPREHSSGKENTGLISPGRFGGRCPWHVEKVTYEGCLGRCPARLWLPWDVFSTSFLGGQKSWLKRWRTGVFCLSKFKARFRIHINMSAFFSLHFRG